jgi:nitroreductase
MLKELVQKTRSYRRFDASFKIEKQTLVDLVDLARLTASGANLQPMKYCISYTKEKNDLIFSCLRWAGYLPDWPGPEAAEHPTAYIILLGDTTISKKFGVDPGITAQTILLGATEKGLGGCLFGSIDRKQLRNILDLPEEYEILNVIALGKPVENVIIDPVSPDGNIRYYRDEDKNHHVPKRSLADVLIGE